MIDEGVTFLITGGTGSMKIVSRYNISGWIEDLEELNDGRWAHACAQFVNNNGNMVSLIINCE